MADKMLEQRGGPHNSHEEHQSFISHAAEKFHLKKPQSVITEKTAIGADAAASGVLERLMTPEALDFVTQTSIATVKGFEERAPKAEFREIIRTIASDTMYGFGTVETSIHHRLATNNPVSMDLIKQYTLPYLCYLGAGLIVVVYLAALVLLVLLFRLLLAPLRGAC